MNRLFCLMSDITLYINCDTVATFHPKIHDQIIMSSIVCLNHSKNRQCKHLVLSNFGIPIYKHIDIKVVYQNQINIYLCQYFFVFRARRTAHILSFAIGVDCWLSSLMIWRLRVTRYHEMQITIRLNESLHIIYLFCMHVYGVALKW